ncbi:uncharacterized protein SETTUDRAFT_95924 [Exserohilum turcica Et28A]|uniref:Uncharacterized protein n=1 Tax=Exserohilum turcicum (strain 28A) TaxID=671987 RepID=R0IBE4_EXST2|nr:uncharacterized protein SETTUDRAFT_95924 [Exserohilum turcica Et28A]EOA82710.1 hypothetical protein SETTUDRAFT_95924 [Exserohilum turcica Et28A]
MTPPPTPSTNTNTNTKSEENKPTSGGDKKSPYTTDVATLPPSGAPSQAHILNLPLSPTSPLPSSSSSITLQDAIATTLFHVSASTLSQFLSPQTSVFKAVFGSSKYSGMQFVVWRRGCEVFTGTFEHHTSIKRFRFEHLAGCLVGYDGAWQLRVTASNAYAATRWGDVWAGKFACEGGVAKMTVEVDEEGMAGRGAVLACEIVAGRYWEGRVDVKCK